MNKRSRQIALVIASIFCASFLVWILLESQRTVVSPEEFISRMEEAGYTVEKEIHLFEQVEVYLIADCGVFYIEFMTHKSMADARLTFDRLRSDLEQLEQLWDVVVHTWSSTGFNSWYEQRTSDGQYARLIRIRDTIIFVSTIEENASHVAHVMEILDQ